MGSHMGVQSFATTRNAQVELLIDFILKSYCLKLQKEQLLNDFAVASQRQYSSDIASDVWDHHVSMCTKKGEFEFWCQTTCYKGNKSGKPEPNKTYEVRETLVEAISLRQLSLANDLLRTVHFTVGPKKYTYDWFAPTKEKTFDLSMYLDIADEDIFSLIGNAFTDVQAEFQAKQVMISEVKAQTKLGALIDSTVEKLYKWHIDLGGPIATLANQQYELVEAEARERADEIRDSLQRSKGAGQNIKKRCNDVVHGANDDDPLILATVDTLLNKNPFISVAKLAVSDWDAFSARTIILSESAANLRAFISALWTAKNNYHLVYRRLLLRVSSEETINYIQDLDIPGITEHNLYKGDYAGETLSRILDHLEGVLSAYNSCKELADALVSKRSRGIVNSSIWFEARNGTDLKPSFDYIVFALEKSGYKIINASKAHDKPIGYHSQLVDENTTVRAYTNLKCILNDKGDLLAYLKGKYFRPQEFPRRCKEEAYVSLTLKYSYDQTKFSEKVNVPIIMFVDMPDNFDPPEYALNRLIAFGWTATFSVEDIIEVIER